MTREEFRNAIRKGQGRVIQRLRDASGEPYLDIIQHACTHHLAYDAQCEGSREDYMLEVVKYVGGLERFRDAILKALRTTESYWDSSQLFSLAKRLAADGDPEARSVMYSRFASNAETTHDPVGAFDIIELDGRQGLQYVASTLGRQCQINPDYWALDIRWFTNEVFAKDQIEVALDEMAKSDPIVQAYVDRLRACESTGDRSPDRPSNKQLEQMPFGELMSHTSLGGAIVGPYMMHRWGKSATEAELHKAATALERETDPFRLKLLVGIFRWRPFPNDPATLLDYLDRYSNDPVLSRRFEVALRIVESPVVRAAALQEIRSGGKLDRGLYLLCANYREGDVDLILKSLPSDDSDADAVHSIGYVLLDLFDDDRISDATEVFEWMWEHSPCSLCRKNAFARLESIGWVPNWMREEAKFDCSASLRAAALGQSDPDE